MYSTNSNLQAMDSRGRIRDALILLMKKYPYEDITITQICQEAQIVRQTYYRNFEFKSDILDFHLDGLLEKYFAVYFSSQDGYGQLRNFFEFMLQNSEFLLLIAENRLFFMIDRTITVNITKFMNIRELTALDEPEYEKYVTGFIASTVCSLLSIWVESGFSETPKMMSEIAQRFLSGL